MAGQVHSRRRGLVALSVVAALLVIGWVVTWQRLDSDRRQLRRQLDAAGERQAGDRFAQALDQLGSEQLDVRLGGIYGLERVAARSAAEAIAAGGAYTAPGQGDPVPDGSAESQAGAPPDGAAAAAWWTAQDRLQVFEILSAYVRTTSHRPPVGPADGPTLQVRQPDVDAAVTVLARRTVLAGDPPLDLSGSVLPNARLGWARLAGADLRGADVRGTSLQHAELAKVHLEQALLCGTEFQDADLRGAHLAGARVSADTRWPSGFDWKASGAKLVAAC
jgi:Pentapeptide repeats (8 copies)